MYLHEEYIKRHKIDVPIILYKHRSTVLLRTQNSPYRWRILGFSWHVPDKHPGFWEMIYSEAVHDGYKNAVLREIDKIDYCYWDEYERCVWWFVEKIGLDLYKAVEPEEQVLAAWQIFLMVYDSWLAHHMDATFSKLVGDSLNPILSRSERMEALDMAQRKLCKDRAINDVWAYQLFPLAKNGSDWLVRLINGN